MSFGSNEEFMFFEMAEPIDFKLVSVNGLEGMSMLYEFKLELTSEESNIEFDDVVGKGCVITIQGNHHTEESGSFTDASFKDRFFHGVVSTFSVLDEGEKFSTYQAIIVPRVWPMQHRVNSRIFQNQSVQDIVGQLLEEVGLANDEVRWDCQSGNTPIEYCVQYMESELNFLSRLIEEEGIFYFFEHEADKHVMVFSDDSSSCKKLPDEDALSYISDAKGFVSNQHIQKFAKRKTLAPGKVTFKDYNFLKPTLKLEAEKTDDNNQDREVFQYGNFADKSRGEHLAKIELESRNALKEIGHGTSNANLLTPGYMFELDDQRRGNYSGEYLLVKVRHEARQSQVYQQYSNAEGSKYLNHFTCIASDTPFRAPIETTRPKVQGTQTAIVAGPAGEEIYTDEHGRIKVQFHWDRYGASNETSSCWIRVSQLWAGQGYGAFSLPRVGQEVIVDFINGNPNDPIVIGRVHHADNRTPYRLPAKKTVTTFKTNSTIGGEGFNELRFDDEKGNEQVFVHAERNKDTRIKNSQFEFVGNDDHKKVINDQFIEVQNDKHEIIGNDSFKQVTGDTHISFDGDLIQNTKGSENITIKGDKKTAISGSENLKSSMDIKLDAGMGYGLKAGTSIDIKAGATLNLQASAAINLKVGGSFINISPAGIFIKGPMVMINSGGSASSASPAKPAKPDAVKAPEGALDADKAEVGKVEVVQDNSMPIEPSEYGPQAKAMKAAARAGTPFCEQCEAAKD